jgi:hypothetical protein
VRRLFSRRDISTQNSPLLVSIPIWADEHLEGEPMATTQVCAEWGLNLPRHEPGSESRASIENGPLGGALGAAALLMALGASLWYLGLQLAQAVANIEAQTAFASKVF